AIVVPPEQHEAARSRVIAHGGGVEVADPAELASAPNGGRPGTLPASLIDAGPPRLAAIGRAYLERTGGDVAVLGAGEPQGTAAAPRLRAPATGWRSGARRKRAAANASLERRRGSRCCASGTPSWKRRSNGRESTASATGWRRWNRSWKGRVRPKGKPSMR